MGQSYEACIAIGLPRGDIENEDLIDDGDLVLFCPYYDGSDDAIAGLEYKSSGEYNHSLFTWDQAAIDELKRQFKELTGLDGDVWITPNAS